MHRLTGSQWRIMLESASHAAHQTGSSAQLTSEMSSMKSKKNLREVALVGGKLALVGGKLALVVGRLLLRRCQHSATEANIALGRLIKDCGWCWDRRLGTNGIADSLVTIADVCRQHDLGVAAGVGAAACLRAGCVSMLLLRRLRTQCNHPAQGHSPCTQGELAHSSTSSSQAMPAYPGVQPTALVSASNSRSSTPASVPSGSACCY